MRNYPPTWLIWAIGCIAAVMIVATAAVDSAAPPAPVPAGACVNRFVVYPGDLNHMGTLFGGRIMAEMDRAAGIAVRRATAFPAEKAVTAGCSVRFASAGRQSDLVRVSAHVTAREGRKLTVAVSAEVEEGRTLRALASATFYFIAVKGE